MSGVGAPEVPAWTADFDEVGAQAAAFETAGRESLVDVALPALAHAGVVLPLLVRHGSPHIEAGFLHASMQTGTVFSHSLLEHGGASDALDLVARCESDAYVLDGTVAYVVNAENAAAHCVVARLPNHRPGSDTVLLMVAADLPGMAVGAPLRGIGDDPTPIATEVRFEAVRVPVQCRVGGDGEGLSLRDGQMERARVLAACSAVAAAERYLQAAWERTATRRSFGTTLRGHQAVRFRLAELRTGLEGSRQLVAAALLASASHGDASLLSAAAKLKASRLVRHAAEECMALHGAEGYLNGHAAVRFVRDARLFSIATGPPEAMLAILAKRSGTDGR